MTAVEWLEEQIEKRYGLTPTSILLFRDAKEMEKEQIIEARVKIILDSNYVEAEQYYNETFKNQLQG